jgi:hypothetical protein
MIKCYKTTHDGNIICFKVGVGGRKISWKQLSVDLRGCHLFHCVRDCGGGGLMSYTRKKRGFPTAPKFLPVMPGKTIKRLEFKKY